MWSVCKKELRQFFSSLTGYIAIIVFLLVNGLMLFVFDNNILDFGYATLDRFFQLAPWIFLLLIPAITMRSFAEEFKTGTFEILQTRPLSRWQIVFGKYFGSLIVVIIALLPTLIYYFTIQKLAAGEGIDAGASIGSYIGLLFLAAVFTAIGICSSSFTNNAVIAFIVSIAACALFYYGFSAISQLPALSGNADYYLEMIGIDFHYRSISRGLVDTRDLVYFFSVIILFLAITNRNLLTSPPAPLHKVESGDKKRGSIINRIWSSKFWSLLLLIFIVAVNFIASSFHARFDLTKEKKYTLSSASKKLLKGLTEPITIDVFVHKKNLPAEVRKLENSIGEFLLNCKEYGKKNFEFRFINPYEGVPDSLHKEMEDSLFYFYGVYPMTLRAPEKVGDELAISKLIHGAVIKYRDTTTGVDLLRGQKGFGTEKEQMAALYNNVEATLEYSFMHAIQKITSNRKPIVGYALGNGEAFGYNINDAFLTLRNYYNTDTVNIKEMPFIPSQIDALVIIKPTIPFSESDKLKIDQYVMRGGKVFWMIDPMYAEFDSLYNSNGFIAFDRGLNIDDILFRYGARINQNLLQDVECDQLGQMSNNPDNPQQRLVDWPFFPVLNGTNHAISKNLDGVRTMFPSTVDTVKAQGIKKTFLLKSSANARILNTPAKIDYEFLQIAPDIKLFTVKDTSAAVLLEGTFQSLYTGRVSRAAADTLASYGVPFLNQSLVDGKMIVVGDGDLAMNSVSMRDGPMPMGYNYFTRHTFANKDFFLNALEYLVNPSDILSTRAKDYTLRLLDPVKTNEKKNMWQIINVAVPIILVILFGLIYQQLRRRKYAV